MNDWGMKGVARVRSIRQHRNLGRSANLAKVLHYTEAAISRLESSELWTGTSPGSTSRSVRKGIREEFIRFRQSIDNRRVLTTIVVQNFGHLRRKYKDHTGHELLEYHDFHNGREFLVHSPKGWRIH